MLRSSEVFQLCCKVLYLGALVTNLVGLVRGNALLRQIALASCPFCLCCLTISWRWTIGEWVSNKYAYSVLLGLALSLCADLILAEPAGDLLGFAGFATYVIALICYSSALTCTSSPPKRGVAGHASTAAAAHHHKIAQHLGEAWPGRAPQPLPVPLRPMRAIPVIIAIVLLAVVWRVADGPHVTDDSRYTAALCVFLVEGLLLWRALARVGYQAPLITVAGLQQASKRRKLRAAIEIELSDRKGGLAAASPASASDGEPNAFAFTHSDSDDDDDDGDDDGPIGASRSISPAGASVASIKRTAKILRLQQRRERNRRQALYEMGAIESRWWQWCGVAGAACVCIGLSALGYDRLWLDDDPDVNGYPSQEATWLTYVHTLLAWLGQTLLAASVPCALPPTGTLDHPAVSPRPTDGPPLRVVILLPAEGYDIAEVAIPWFQLTRRGHSVAFATRDGVAGLELNGRLPVPFEPSVHGYGCGGGGGGSGGNASGSCLTTIFCCRNRTRRRAANPLLDDPQLAPRTCCGCSAARRSDGRSAWCCGSDLCSFSAVGVGMGAPGPLVVAIYREMLEDPAFRRPLAWSRRGVTETLRRLPKRYRARYIGHPSSTRRRSSRRRRRGASPQAGGPDGNSSGSDRDSGSSITGSDVDASTNPSDLLLVPESFDGLIIAGCHPPSSEDNRAVWDDSELQHIAAGFWASGRPMATFSNAAVLLARSLDLKSGRPLLASASAVAAATAAVERATAFLGGLLRCAWGPYSALLSSPRGAGGAGPSVEEEVTSVVGKGAFLTGSSPFSASAVLRALVRSELPFLRGATPFDDAACVLAESGRYLSAQGGGDAFLLASRFIARLEEVQRSF